MITLFLAFLFFFFGARRSLSCISKHVVSNPWLCALLLPAARVLQARPSERKGAQIEFGAGGCKKKKKQKKRGKLNNVICM